MRVHENSMSDLAFNNWLNNRIHPLFGGPLRSAVDEFWVVELSAKLATHYLESGLLDQVILALYNDGQPGILFRDSKGNQGREIRIKDPSEGDQCKVKAILHRLAETVSFTIDEMISADAVTEWIEEDDCIDELYANGRRSIVKISRKKYDMLLAAQEYTGSDVPWLLQSYVDFANILIHEIGHVIDNASHAYREPTYLGDSILSEPGFEMETHIYGGRLTKLFGGHPDVDRWGFHKYEGYFSEMTGVVALLEYPYQGIVGDYHGGGGLNWRGDPKNLRTLDVAWRVPMSFLESLFDDSFWEQDLEVIRKALRPRCDVGYCFRWDEDQQAVAVKKTDGDETKMYVPKGFRRASTGCIVREDEEEIIDTGRFWSKRSQDYHRGSKRKPWKYAK